MQTTIFEWWKRKGRTVEELAERLNYSADYLYHLKSGRFPVTESFMARCVLHLGDDVRFLFFGDGVRPERMEQTATESSVASPG